MSLSKLQPHSPVSIRVPLQGERCTKDELYRHIEDLRENIDFDVLVPCLKEDSLLNAGEAYTVQNPCLLVLPDERIHKLLTYVSRKEDGPDKFVECIAKTARESTRAPGHVHLIQNVLGVKPEQDINADIYSGVSSIREKERNARMLGEFVPLLTKTSIQLRTQNMGKFKIYVSYLPPSENNPDQSIARSDKKKIQGASTPDEIFHVLTNGDYLGYRKPFLLYLIVNEFGSENLIDEVEKYMYREQLESNREQLESNPSESAQIMPLTVLHQILKFARLVIKIQTKFEELDVLESLKVFATLLPMEYGQMEQPHYDAIASASDVSSIFGILGYYWDWQRFRLLKCIAETLIGTIEVQRMVSEYQSGVPQQQPGHCETPAVETELFDYRIQFARLVFSTLMYLEQSDITLEMFCKFFASRLQHHQFGVLEPASDAAKSWSAIFLVLNRCWDHFNFNLLHDVLESFQIHDLLPQFLCYREAIDSFTVITPLSVLVQALPSCHPPARTGFAKMSIRFDATESDHLFVHFVRFRQSFAREFDIPEYAIRIHTITFYTESFHDTKQYYYKFKCYIPSSVACLLIVESRAKGHFYEEHRITHLTFHEDKHYYFSCSILESGSLSILQQAKVNPDVCRRLKELGADLEANTEHVPKAALAMFQRL